MLSICFCLVSPASVPLDTSLTMYIREYAQLKGTKFMCLEGGCGACTVTLKGIHPVTKELVSFGIKSVCKKYQAWLQKIKAL